MEKNSPEKKFVAGPISATIWKNTGKGKNGEEVEYRTVSLQRSYKDKKDEWQHTNSMRVVDIPRAVLVMNKAYEFLSLKDVAGTGEDLPGPDIEVEEIM